MGITRFFIVGSPWTGIKPACKLAESIDTEVYRADRSMLNPADGTIHFTTYLGGSSFKPDFVGLKVERLN